MIRIVSTLVLPTKDAPKSKRKQDTRSFHAECFVVAFILQTRIKIGNLLSGWECLNNSTLVKFVGIQKLLHWKFTSETKPSAAEFFHAPLISLPSKRFEQKAFKIVPAALKYKTEESFLEQFCRLTMFLESDKLMSCDNDNQVNSFNVFRESSDAREALNSKLNHKLCTGMQFSFFNLWSVSSPYIRENFYHSARRRRTEIRGRKCWSLSRCWRIVEEKKFSNKKRYFRDLRMKRSRRLHVSYFPLGEK